MSQQTYTVREMAALISPSQDRKAVEQLTRQLRYWTTEEIITPEGGNRHTGSGKHRQYDIHQVRKAAITAELVRHGISLVRLGPFGEYLDFMQEDPNWQEAIKGKLDVFITHAEELADDPANLGDIGPKSKLDPLEPIIRRDIIGKDTLGAMDYMNYPTIIVINITKLFIRLDLIEE